MADVVEDQESNNTNTDETTETEGSKNPEGGSDLFEGIPEDHPVRKEVSKLRTENASKRQSIHERDALVDDLKAKLEGAKSAEELDALKSEYDRKLAEKELLIARKDVAREFSLPAKVESALKGEDLEALRAEAKEWQELFGTKKPEPLKPSGGRTPGSSPDDAKSFAAKIRAQRQ